MNENISTMSSKKGMSARTHGLILSAICMAFSAPALGAPSMSAAVANEHRAYNNYYIESVKLGPNASDAQNRELYRRIIVPAASESNATKAKLVSGEVKSVHQQVVELARGTASSAGARWLKKVLGLNKGSGEKGGAQAAAGQSKSQAPVDHS